MKPALVVILAVAALLAGLLLISRFINPRGTCLQCGQIATMPRVHGVGLWVNFVTCPNCRSSWPVGMWWGKEPTSDEYMQMLAASRGEEGTAAAVWLQRRQQKGK